MEYFSRASAKSLIQRTVLSLALLASPSIVMFIENRDNGNIDKSIDGFYSLYQAHRLTSETIYLASGYDKDIFPTPPLQQSKEILSIAISRECEERDLVVLEDLCEAVSVEMRSIMGLERAIDRCHYSSITSCESVTRAFKDYVVSHNSVERSALSTQVELGISRFKIRKHFRNFPTPQPHT